VLSRGECKATHQHAEEFFNPAERSRGKNEVDIMIAQGELGQNL